MLVLTGQDVEHMGNERGKHPVSAVCDFFSSGQRCEDCEIVKQVATNHVVLSEPRGHSARVVWKIALPPEHFEFAARKQEIRFVGATKVPTLTLPALVSSLGSRETQLFS